jgi:hypothetical protein
MRRHLLPSIDFERRARKQDRTEPPLVARINLALWLLAGLCFAFAALVWWRLLG